MKKKILIIDDSKTFHTYIKAMLETHFELIHLYDSRSSLEIAIEKRPDLFLVDLEMPFLCGKQVSKLLSTHDTLKATPILIMTGSFSDSLYVESIEIGASDILPKSSSASMIINKINAIIRQKEFIQKEIEDRQLDAIKALIATSNHEFNNALFISDQFLNKVLKDVNENDTNYPSLLKIKAMNERILLVVKKLANIDKISISTTEANKDFSMLKI